ncbi:hypothetical protein [Gordonia alkanivorans]|uniref:hypothetical protein n=1 Tax=Gordonia alkanivorans TaxID=84096 RepID=UPI001FCA340B|nr:hypothetical protein [Gordonia alkanivorans]
MTHLVPAVRIIAALMFSAALAGGVATANAPILARSNTRRWTGSRLSRLRP